MSADQSARPFASIFGDDPVDGAGESFSYGSMGRSKSDGAASNRDFSPYTDEQPKQAKSVKSGGDWDPEEGETEEGANSYQGKMIDETRPKTFTKPVMPAPKSRAPALRSSVTTTQKPAKGKKGMKAKKPTKKKPAKKVMKARNVKKVKRVVKKPAPKKLTVAKKVSKKIMKKAPKQMKKVAKKATKKSVKKKGRR